MYVKERSYVHGRKRIPEHWKKANTVPLSEEAALSLGGSAVDNSAAASFRIKEASGKARRLKINVDPWSMIKFKFYKKGNTFIEKSSNRIDSTGELKGISALGWIANQQKAYLPMYKASATPKVKAVQMVSIKAFDINKYLRGVGL